jgi:hypothetical protein
MGSVKVSSGHWAPHVSRLGGGIQRIYDVGGIQVQKVTTASQSKSGCGCMDLEHWLHWLHLEPTHLLSTLATLTALGAVNSPGTVP